MKKKIVFEQFGALEHMSKSDDIAYWQGLGPQSIFEAAWQMALDYHRFKEGKRFTFTELSLDEISTVALTEDDDCSTPLATVS
ncbi:hypothetical protein MRY87_03985, partial [bacterium]|nr:hypothetical protein [bacterium]